MDKRLEAIKLDWASAEGCYGEAICEQAQADIQYLLGALEERDEIIAEYKAFAVRIEQKLDSALDAIRTEGRTP